MKFTLNKSAQTIIYKLLGDLLAIGLIFFALMLVSEAVLPGVVTAHVSFTGWLIFLSLTFLTMSFLGKKIGANSAVSDNQTNKRSVLTLSVLGIAIVTVALIKFGIMAGLIILVLVVFSGYLMYRTILEP